MKMRFLSCFLGLCLSAGLNAQRTIQADLNQVKGPMSAMFKECVGAGRANEGLRADWQQQLAMVQKEIGFKYLRFHGLLHDDMRVYVLDKQGRATYNWQNIDRLFDFMLSVKIRPFVEFSFMPSDLASGTKTIFWWKGNVTPPSSYPKWDSLITALVGHWEERYGREELNKWYFEVWNEPDLRGFFDGTQEQYFELYNHTARAVRAVSKTYKVGGPATSGTKWISEFLHYCDSARLPLDFISTHDYGTNSVLDEFGTKKQKLKPVADTIARNVTRVRNIIRNSAFPNAELHFTEWNSSPSSRDPIHDSYQNASYILTNLRRADDASSMSYWTFTDIFEEAGSGLTPLHGGFGLLNHQNIRKPSYLAYYFLNELGNQELKNSDSLSYVCRKGNDLQILFWNTSISDVASGYDQDFFSKEQPSRFAESVSISIKNVKDGDYKMELYQVGYGKNDVLTKYKQMGSPAQLTRKQETELAQASGIKPALSRTVTVRGGKFMADYSLRTNEIYLIKLTRL